MKIGCLGEVVFEVSDKQIQTLRDPTWKGSAKIQTHERHLDNAVQEFVGINPDEFSFNIKLSKHLGADPMAEIGKIFSYERSGTPVPLVIGSKAYGKDMWLVKDHTVNLEAFDKKGDVVSADVAINLTEYLED